MNSIISNNYRFKILLSVAIVLCASILNREFILTLLIAYIAEHGWLFFISQVAVAALGVPAIFVSQSLSRSTNRWASVLGLCGQPFWYMMAYATAGWGLFILSLFYTAGWWRGFKNYWLTSETETAERLLGESMKNITTLNNGQLQTLLSGINKELVNRADYEV